MSSLHGKVVLITGGTKGLGKAMAELLASEGAVVVTTSRKASASAKLEKAAGRVQLAQLDVRDEKSVAALFEKLERELGRLDLLVNNAGIGAFKPLTEYSLQEWEDILRVNLTGAFLCCKQAFARMKKAGGGRIINIGSIADHLALAENGAYAASKFGLRGLSLVLNEEGKSCNVRVSLVSPGAVYTEIWHGREGFKREDMLQPEDVARTVLDIASRPLHVRIDEVRILPPKGVL